MFDGLRITMLLSDGFGGFGGISRFNRDFLTALDISPDVARVYVLPRLILETISESIPETVVYDRKAAAGKVAFLLRVLAHGLHDDGTNLVICGHLNLLPAAYFLARVQRARLALVIHGIEAWEPTKNRLVNRLARRVDAFIAVSSYSAGRFASWSLVPPDRGYVLPNCVDLERFLPGQREQELAARYGLEGKKVLVTLGRLASEERYKGFDEVIGALPELVQRFPDLVYLVVGDGHDRNRLAQKAKNLNVGDNVIFAGRIHEQEKVAHYNLADVYVMPSSGEGFGIVLIEAAACGLPVIGSNADGSREALLGGQLGQLVDPRDRAALIEAVTHALDHPGPHCRLAAVETFSTVNFRRRVSSWARHQLGAVGPKPNRTAAENVVLG